MSPILDSRFLDESKFLQSELPSYTLPEDKDVRLNDDIQKSKQLMEKINKRDVYIVDEIMKIK